MSESTHPNTPKQSESHVLARLVRVDRLRPVPFWRPNPLAEPGSGRDGISVGEIEMVSNCKLRISGSKVWTCGSNGSLLCYLRFFVSGEGMVRIYVFFCFFSGGVGIKKRGLVNPQGKGM